ncbi:MAG TPA: hypothetical protein VG326_07095 [Tepidisphaeraceae bacterium]|jgi:hypothetical protein|nr:hypothetical protein [Tepidisphaeraceae bacterium]
MKRFFSIASAVLMGIGFLTFAGCQDQNHGADTTTGAGTYNNAPGLPDNSAGTSIYNPPGSMQHVGNQSDSGVLGGGTAHDPNSATPGS